MRQDVVLEYTKKDHIKDLANEIWVELFTKKYKISNLGRIKIYSLFKPPMIARPSTDNLGYKMVGLYINGKPHNHRVHRLLAQKFIPNPHNYPIINHINGNKKDNRLENLEWCTYSQNLMGARIRKPGVLGEKHYLAKFTNAQVRKIFNSNKTGVELAKEYNVTINAISYIKTGKRWSHITKKKYVKKDRHWIEYNDKRMMLCDWAKLFKVSHASLLSKMRYTKSFDKIYEFYKLKNAI